MFSIAINANNRKNFFERGMMFWNFSQHKTYNCLEKNNKIFQTKGFNHTMIFFKLTDQYKINVNYIDKKYIYKVCYNKMK